MVRLAEIASAMQLVNMAMPRQGRRIVTMNGLYVLASLLAAMGVIVTLAGAYIWLSTHYPFEIALLIMGGTLITGGIVFAAIAAWLSHRAERSMRKAAGGMVHGGTDFIKSLLAELDEPIKENPILAMGAAALSGYVAGEKVAENRAQQTVEAYTSKLNGKLN